MFYRKYDFIMYHWTNRIVMIIYQYYLANDKWHRNLFQVRYNLCISFVRPYATRFFSCASKQSWELEFKRMQSFIGFLQWMSVTCQINPIVIISFQFRFLITENFLTIMPIGNVEFWRKCINEEIQTSLQNKIFLGFIP